MTSKASGGSAFPQVVNDPVFGTAGLAGGMTLRDYYLGQSVEPIVALMIASGHNFTGPAAEEIAEEAGKLADALLLEAIKAR